MGGGQQLPDLFVGEQKRCRPRGAVGQQSLRRHLRDGVKGMQIARESAHDRQPALPAERIDARWLRRPGQRQVNAHRCRSAAFDKICELRQQQPVLAELEAHGAAQRQVLAHSLMNRVHTTPPGHSRATTISAPGSSWTYRTVVAWWRCRSTSLISASGAPARRNALAAVCRSRCAPIAGRPARVHARTTTPLTLLAASALYGARVCRNR